MSILKILPAALLGTSLAVGAGQAWAGGHGGGGHDSRDGGRQGSGQHAAGATSRSAGDRVDGTGPEDAETNDGGRSRATLAVGADDKTNDGPGNDPDNIRYGDQTSPDNGGPVRRR
jgi:hypothetical protein